MQLANRDEADAEHILAEPVHAGWPVGYRGASLRAGESAGGRAGWTAYHKLPRRCSWDP